MKKHPLILCAGITSLLLSACNPVKVPEAILPVPEAKQVEWQKMETYAFVHFGLNTFNDREWGYGDSDPKTFNPAKLDCEQWVKTFVESGMKGVILTAKHHDGFCLFDSKLTEYKSTNTRFGRDIVREFLEAFRAEGIAVGLYFSLLDWSHPDFPKYADRHHPMRGREEYCGEQIDFDNYLNFMHGQVKELVTGYGKLDLLWFDFSYDDMAGEKWRASDLISMVRKYQPDVCIDNRLEGSGEKYGSIATASPATKTAARPRYSTS